jgi:hypothetical protein
MPVVDNHTYFKKRALVERRRARAAPKPEIAAIHLRLAEAYEALLAEIEARPPLRLVHSGRNVVAEPGASFKSDNDDRAVSGP